MIDADNLHEAEQQALGQLAQMDLALAARLHALAMNAEEPKEIIELTRAYQRASRCVRQNFGTSTPSDGGRRRRDSLGRGGCSLAVQAPRPLTPPSNVFYICSK